MPLILFWISLSILFYSYLGYGLLILLVNGLKRLLRPLKNPAQSTLPAITLIIPAYNEREILERKIQNTLDSNYPSPLLQVIVITDGSDDGSQSLSLHYPSITWLHQPERQGKYAAIARAMETVQTPIVVFSDANSMLNKDCLLEMMPHYTNDKIGGVAGEKKIVHADEHSVVGEAEGFYWQYESFLKQQDAQFYTVVGAAGEFFSIRTELFHKETADIILDDFIISMRVCLQGKRIAYEPKAFATEFPSASLKEEAKRKVRISAGAYQSIGILKECLNPFLHPRLFFQYASRCLLRWVFCPLLLIVLLVSNIYLVRETHDHNFYLLFLYLQLAFYLLALIGAILVRLRKKSGILSIPFYFLFMNYCQVRGFLRFITRKQSAIWERSLRERVS